MGRFFKRLSLPGKLIVLGGLPLIFLVWLTFQYTLEKEEKIRLIQTYRQQVAESDQVNTLIDHLQIERRFSFGFALQGRWLNDMLLQRQKTDEGIKKLENMGGNRLSHVSSFTLLDHLPAVRKRLDAHQIPPQEVMDFYSNAIFRLGSINTVTAQGVPALEQVASDLEAQNILSDMITYQGIVRSQIYRMMVTRNNDPQLISSVKQMLEIMTTYVKEFNLKASPQRKQELEEIGADTDVQITNLIQDGVRSNSRVDTAIGADYWWDVSANSMDRIRSLQQDIMEDAGKTMASIESEQSSGRNLMLVLLSLMLVLIIFMIVFLINHITEILTELRRGAEKLARGESNIDLKIQSRDAIGSLAKSITTIDHNNQSLAIAAQRIGTGDFSTPVRPRSEDDVLGNALVLMNNNLKRYDEENKEEIWKQTGMNLINELLLGERSITAISNDVLRELATYLEMDHGIFYIATGTELHYAAGYAIADKASIPQQLAFGETLVGQAAVERKPMVLQDVQGDSFNIRSALVDLHPREVLIIPLTNYRDVEGVIELSGTKPAGPVKMAFLKDVANSIAVSLRAIKSREKLQELFEETTAQSEELRSQHNELENINTELEAQAQKLQASEEELRVQQEELTQANQELEERSRLLEEKNQLISERNLDIQRKAEELEQSTRYKSEFLANMSHELRTPLNSILLLSRLLSENAGANLTPDQVEYAQVIQTSGQGLLSLIDEILDLSRIEAGKMDIEFLPVPLSGVIGDLQPMFAPVAKDKGVELRVELAEDLPSTIETDKMRLEQILKNLLSNALKFTAHGSVTLKLEKADPGIRFSVIDTGIGIAADKQALIFDAFQQADGSTRRKFGGTGLGLSISRELCRLLGGVLSVSSEPGQGSNFMVWLPLKPGENIPAPAEKTSVVEDIKQTEKTEADRERYISQDIPQSIEDDRDSLLPGEKAILIVEDDTLFAKALLDYTRRKGYKGIVAVRGDEGIELARKFHPQGILLDIQLPVMDGWQVMDELKKDPQTRPIPVHIMSANSVRKESLLKGAVDFIDKPVALEKLQEVFKKLEQVVGREHKKVLIIEENPKHAQALAFFLETCDVSSEISNTIPAGIDALMKEGVDCVILDMGIPDTKAYETLERIKKDSGLENLPVIIFTGKNLSKSEETRIRQYADTIVVKTAHSYQRILDEVSLFLHLMEAGSNGEKKSSKHKRLGALSEVLQGRKVLVTDDDVRNIFSLTKSLERHGMKVFTATDGKEALNQLEQHPDMDIVLMDIMMPEMDGYEAIRQIRSQPRFRNLPVITVTAKAMTGDRERSIEAGASDYISKPIDTDQLLSLLRVWLYDRNM